MQWGRCQWCQITDIGGKEWDKEKSKREGGKKRDIQIPMAYRKCKWKCKRKDEKTYKSKEWRNRLTFEKYFINLK